VTDPISYVDAEALAAKLAIKEADTDSIADVTQIASDASRQVDDYCGRYFGSIGTTQSPVVRSFPVENGLCLLDDLQSWSLIEAYTGTSWTTYDSTGLVFGPENAPTMLPARPWDLLTFPEYRWKPERIRITGVWGWAAVPSQVSRAAWLQAIRLFKSPSVSLGVVGGADNMGVLRLSAQLQPDARELLRPFVKVNGG